MFVLCTNTRMFFMHTYTNAHTRLFCVHIHECFYTYTCTVVYIYTYVLYTMHAFLQACNHQVTVTWKGIISTYCFKKTKLLQLVTNIFSPSIYKSSFLMKILELKRLVSSHTKHDQVRHIMVLQKAKAGVCTCTCIIEITIPQHNLARYH